MLYSVVRDMPTHTVHTRLSVVHIVICVISRPWLARRVEDNVLSVIMALRVKQTISKYSGLHVL